MPIVMVHQARQQTGREDVGPWKETITNLPWQASVCACIIRANKDRGAEMSRMRKVAMQGSGEALNELPSLWRRAPLQ